MVVRIPTRSLRFGAIVGWLVLGAHAGCVPDFDRLSSGDGGSPSGSGGATTGSTTMGGGPGASSSGDPSGSGGTSGSQSAATQGGSGGSATDGGAGDAGEAGMSAGAGAGGEDSGMCGAGLATCPGESECIDLGVGDPNGSSVTHCGTCGLTCSVSNATSAGCDDGTCEPSCMTGFDDCNAQAANDGCETDITVVENCGECGYACSTSGATDVECTAGRCDPTCTPYAGNCNATATLSSDDGCETYLDSLTQCRPDCATAAAPCGALEVCTGGDCVAPQGMVVFSVPLTEADQNQRYADLFAGGEADLTNARIVVRLYAPGATGGGYINLYFTDFDNTAGPGVTPAITDFAAGWKEVTINVGTSAGDFDATRVRQLNLEVVSTGVGPWSPNPLLIYVDLVRAANGLLDDTFETDCTSGATCPPMTISSLQSVPGSTLTWTDSVP